VDVHKNSSYYPMIGFYIGHLCVCTRGRTVRGTCEIWTVGLCPMWGSTPPPRKPCKGLPQALEGLNHESRKARRDECRYI